MSESDASKDLWKMLDTLKDPRKKRGVRYRYSDLLLMCIYAILCGYDESTQIEYYVELNLDYFQNLMGIERAPSHDTFARIMRLTDFEKLGCVLGTWLSSYFPEIHERYEELEILHVDGKAVCGSAEKSKGQQPRYLLNAMYEGESIGVFVKEVGDKENEISKLPDFLDLFNLKDTIVTADAMACNNTVISKILEKEGSYVFPLKSNQRNLYNAVKKEIEKLEETGDFEKLETKQSLSKEHGRSEIKTTRVIKNTAFICEDKKLGTRSFYSSIARIGIIDKKVTQMKEGKEEISSSRMMLITNLEWAGAEDIEKLRKLHWNIEMNHWLLDIQLNEDRSTARKGYAMPTAGVLRRLCMVIREHDEELRSRPLNRFKMANVNNIYRIENLLFKEIALSGRG